MKAAPPKAEQKKLALPLRTVSPSTAMGIACSKRDSLLLGIADYRDRHSDELGLGVPTTLTRAQFTQLMQYAQALRACTSGCTDPTQIVWPTPPSFVG